MIFFGEIHGSTLFSICFFIFTLFCSDRTILLFLFLSEQAQNQSSISGVNTSSHIGFVQSWPGYSTDKFVCRICFKEYRYKRGLSQHMQKHAGRRFPCPICDTKFTEKGTLKRHLIGFHALLQCSACSETYRESEAGAHRCLDAHVKEKYWFFIGGWVLSYLICIASKGCIPTNYPWGVCGKNEELPKSSNSGNLKILK